MRRTENLVPVLEPARTDGTGSTALRITPITPGRTRRSRSGLEGGSRFQPIGGEPRNHPGRRAVIAAIGSEAMSRPVVADLDAGCHRAPGPVSAASARLKSSSGVICSSALGHDAQRPDPTSSPGWIPGFARCCKPRFGCIRACMEVCHGAIWECGTTTPREELHLALATLEQLRSPVGGNPGPFWALFRKTHPVTGEVNGRGASGSMAMHYCGRHYIRGTVGAYTYASGWQSTRGQKPVATTATLPKGGAA